MLAETALSTLNKEMEWSISLRAKTELPEVRDPIQVRPPFFEIPLSGQNPSKPLIEGVLIDPDQLVEILDRCLKSEGKKVEEDAFVQLDAFVRLFEGESDTDTWVREVVGAVPSVVEVESLDADTEKLTREKAAEWNKRHGAKLDRLSKKRRKDVLESVMAVKHVLSHELSGLIRNRVEEWLVETQPIDGIPGGREIRGRLDRPDSGGKIESFENEKPKEIIRGHDSFFKIGTSVPVDTKKPMSKVPPGKKSPQSEEMVSAEIPPENASLVNQVRELEAERIELIDELEKLVAENRPLIRDALVEKAVKCGRKTCRCVQGELHRKVYLSVSVDGRIRKIYVRLSEEQDYIDGIKNYKDWSRIRNRLAELCTQQIELTDAIRDTQLADSTPPPQKPGRRQK